MATEIQEDEFFVPPEYADEMRGAFGGEGIRLPYTVVYWKWQTANAVYKTYGNAPYFGGWIANVGDVDLAVDEYGPLPMFDPKTKRGTFGGPFTIAKRDGGEFEAYGARALAVAVLGKRYRWIEERPGQAKRSHVQVLGYMGYSQEGKIIQPWGPVVLIAKGLSAKFVTNAFRDFDSKTRRARQQHAHGIPAWFFYAIVGTFGDKPVTTMVGQAGAQSPITPCDVYLPSEVSADHLKTWFIGEGLIDQALQLRRDAKEWLEDARWKSGKFEAEPETEDAGEGPDVWVEGEVPF
jgi:hypothetical protein